MDNTQQTANTEVYIEFLNKEKNFQRDKVYFDSYELAAEWARENLERFDPDMVRSI